MSLDSLDSLRILKIAARPLLRGAPGVIAIAILFVSCSHREGRQDIPTPATLDTSEAYSDYGMVSSGSEEATRAGVQILEQGGNAVDAAVAAAFTLGVADPGGSGLGGMTYILFSSAEGHAITIDGTATAPVGADRLALLELRDSGKFFGAKAVAVPATLAALSHALNRYGTMNLETVLAPAIRYAEEGSRLNSNSIAWMTGYFKEILASRYLRYVVLDNGEHIGSVGDYFCRPDLAGTLRQIALEGSESFYRGTIAHKMLADVAALGGYLHPLDLSLIRATELEPLRSEYRGAEVISYPWPGGGAEVTRSLQILETFSPEFLRKRSADRLHVMIEVSRIARADSLEFIQSPSLQGMGPAGYLSVAEARMRANLITPGRAIPEDELRKASTTPRMGEHTTHVSVADRWGNAVSMTQTLCRQYGAKVATPGLGFPYNSCLEFFDYENPSSPDFLIPRARYSSTMAPTIIRRDGSLLVLGSAGSDRIPGSEIEVISSVIDRDMGIRDAVIAPRVLWNSSHDPPRVCLEITDWVTEADADTLQSWGFEDMFRLEYPAIPAGDSAFFGGVNAVLYDAATGIFSGAGDPRRSGYAEGPRAVANPRERP
jgi:gamma-glutamyltranspeptidase/glutathione hydrolase